MALTKESYEKLVEKIKQSNNAPDIKELVERGDLIKRGAKYEIANAAAYELVSMRIKSIELNTQTGKALYTFYAKRKIKLPGENT